MDSTRTDLTQEIRLAADGSECLVRSTARQRKEMERLIFRRYPDQERGTFFRFGYRRTKWGLLVCLVDLLPPSRDIFDPASGIVEFRAAYVRRAMRALGDSALGIGFVHSHPEDCQPMPSPLDDDMDAYSASEFEKFSNGRPYVSLIVSRDGSGKRYFSGRSFDSGAWRPVKEWVVAGDDVLRREAEFGCHAGVYAEDPTRERVSELFGSSVVERMRNSTIGIIGCSGLGSPAAHILARAEIRRFVLVDKGRFKASNLERNHASRKSDRKGDPPWKVELLARLIHEISPSTEVIQKIGDVLDESTLDELTRCDLVLGCTDSMYARAALGDIANHYLVPVLDLAVQMSAPEGLLREQVGEIARYAPGLPCPWCRNRVNAAAIREETMTENEAARLKLEAIAARKRGEDGAQYWAGARHQELTVGYMTTAVAAIGAGYAQHWLSGVAKIPHDRFQFDLGLKEFGFVKAVGFADQGQADRTVSKPMHW